MGGLNYQRQENLLEAVYSTHEVVDSRYLNLLLIIYVDHDALFLYSFWTYLNWYNKAQNFQSVVRNLIFNL